jgi:hypothetical protein
MFDVLFALRQLSISVLLFPIFLTYHARIFPALAGRGFAHHGCCAGSEEPRYDPLVHDDVGGRVAPSPAAFTDCDSQTDSLSITTVGARMAKRDFACGDSCVTLNDVCKQIYPFASEVVSDIIEANEEAHTASICDAVDSATSVCVTVEQGSPFGDDEDEIVPYVLPKMEKNRAKVSAKPHYH